MNSMFDRLGDKLRAYLEKDNDVFDNPNTNPKDSFDNIDEDMLDDGEEKPVEGGWHYKPSFSKTYNHNTYRANSFNNNQESIKKDETIEKSVNNDNIRLKPYPAILKNDFLKLGVTPGSPLEICKAAQIKLLKQYHPDRAGNDEYGKMKATVMCSLVNESFSRIKNWYEHGKIN